MSTENAILNDIKQMQDRCCIPSVLNKHGFTGKVSEIGVDMAHFADIILRGWKGNTYYAVDLWEKQDPAIYPEVFDHDLSFKCASDIANRDRRMVMMRMSSTEASKQIRDESLDWVWIDANHDFLPVFQDMTAWWPKVRRGAIFSGHDYPLPTVMAAVQAWRFINQRESELVVVDSSWYMIKS